MTNRPNCMSGRKPGIDAKTRVNTGVCAKP